jgi:hypothetical protein
VLAQANTNEKNTVQTRVFLALAMCLGLDAPAAAGTYSYPNVRASLYEDTIYGFDVARLDTQGEGSLSVEIGTMDPGGKIEISSFLNRTFLTSLITSQDLLKMPPTSTFPLVACCSGTGPMS